MVTVKGVYEKGSIRLLEDVPLLDNSSVVVTIFDDTKVNILNGADIPEGFFDDLVGVVEGGENDSVDHDILILGHT